MTDDALQLLTENSEYAILLRAYETARDCAPQPTDEELEGAGWVARLVEVPGIDGARLAPLHGKLIAHGLLHFQLTGRTSGVVYRVSPAGDAMLGKLESGSIGEATADDGAWGEDGDEFLADAAA